MEDWTLDYHKAKAVKCLALVDWENPAKGIEELHTAKVHINKVIELLDARQNEVGSNAPLQK